MQNSEYKTVIESGKGVAQYWRDLWKYRELFYFLAWRDILVKYKQTVIGVAWSLVRPLITMIIFTFVFGRLAKLDIPGVPYPIVVFSALLPWQFFANSLGSISNSIVGNSNLISKIYFPRLIIPVSTVIVNLVDFVISLVILAGLMIWYKFVPDARILLLPIFLLLTFGAALGFGLWMASLNVKYRDFTHIVPFVVQLGLYISPVGFSISIVPEKWRLLYSLNPMVGIIEGFRWALISQGEFYSPSLLISVGIIVGMLALGIKYFRKTERTFADTI